MLLLCHIFIGALLGLLIYRWKGEIMAVPLAALGAILPDLVDKPLGHLLLQETLDNGRIFGHSLLFTGMVFTIVAVVGWKKYSPLVIALLAGLISHLILDAMWMLPTTLFWPLLGPFPQESYPDYFSTSVVRELLAPSEYAFLGGIGLIAAALWNDRLGPLQRVGDVLLRNRRVVYAALFIIGGAYIVLAAVHILEGSLTGQNELILAVALLFGGAMLRSLDPGGERQLQHHVGEH